MLGRGGGGCRLVAMGVSPSCIFFFIFYFFFFVICSPLSMSPLREWAERAHGIREKLRYTQGNGRERLERRHREKTTVEKKREKEKRVETIYDRRTILSALRHVMRNH